MAGRKSVIATEESAPASPLRRSSRISTASATAPIIGRRSSATAVESAPAAKLTKGKRLSLSQDITEERPGTPKRTTKLTRAASKSPTALTENEAKPIGTPSKRGRRTSITKPEEDKMQSTPTTVAGRRRSVRGQSTSPTSDKPEPSKTRGRRTSVTDKVAPLVPIEEMEEVKKPARARRTSLTSRRASVEESNVDSAIDSKRILTVQLTHMDVEVKKTPRGRGRPSKISVEEAETKKAKTQELNPIIETSFTDDLQEKIKTPLKESPNKSHSKSPKKSLSAEKLSSVETTSPIEPKIQTPVKSDNTKSINTPKKLFDNEVEEENFELLIEESIENTQDDSKPIMETKENTEIESKKSLKEDGKIEGKSTIKDMENKESQEKIVSIDKCLDEDRNKENKEAINKLEDSQNVQTPITKEILENLDVLEVSSSVPVEKCVSEKQVPKTPKSRLSKSLSENMNVLTPDSDKVKSVSTENLNKSKLKDDSSFKSPRIAKKKNDDPLLSNPLEMTFGSDGSFHLNLSIPASNNSQEKNDSKSDDIQTLNTTGGSDNSDKENLTSPLNSPKKLVKMDSNEIAVLSVHSVENDKMNTSTPRISLNSSKAKTSNEGINVECSNLDSSIAKSISENVVSSTRMSLGKSKLIEEEFCSSPVKKINPVKSKNEEISLIEDDIIDSFVDEVNDGEDLNEEEISKILESPPSTIKKQQNQADVSSEKENTEEPSTVTEVVDVETAVTIIKGSPKTKRLSLKLKHSSEENLGQESNNVIDDEVSESCLQENVNKTNNEIIEITINEKDATQTCQMSEELSTSEITTNEKDNPVLTSSKKKKRMSNNIEKLSDNDSIKELKENIHESPITTNEKTKTPKLEKSSIKTEEMEEFNSPKKSPELEKVSETVVVIDDDDDIKVTKTPKRKSFKLMTSSGEDLTNLKNEEKIKESPQSEESSKENSKTPNKSRRERRRSKKLLENQIEISQTYKKEENESAQEIIEINEDSSEIHCNRESEKNTNDSSKLDVQEESNDVEYINDNIIEQDPVNVSDDIQFVENVSPKKKTKKDKRKSKSFDKDNDANLESKDCKTPSKTHVNKDSEESNIEIETVDMHNEESNDIELIKQEEKTPVKSNKGSKRIKRDIETVGDEILESKITDGTILFSDDKKSKKAKRKSQKQQTSEENLSEEVKISKETPPSSRKKRKSLKKQESKENINLSVEEETNEIEIIIENKEKSLVKPTPVKLSPIKPSPDGETKRSKRMKITHDEIVEDSVNDELNVISLKSSPVEKNQIESERNTKRSPKQAKRRSQKQQIEDDLFGGDPVNKVPKLISPPKDEEKAKDGNVKNYDSEDERLDFTINNLITKKLASETKGVSENEDDSDEDFAPPCDFLDYEAMEGSPESSPSHSNDIIDEGESLHSSDTEEESDLVDEEDYENDSFIDDDEFGELLSGNEYDLNDEKVKKKKGNGRTKKKSRIIVVSDSEEENESKVKDTLASEFTESEDVNSEENMKKINIIQNIVISPQTQNTQSEENKDIEETESENIVELKNVETKLLVDTPNNSFADISTSSSKRNRSKRKTSISIQEKLSLTNSTDIEINEKISKAVDFFCSSIKDKSGNVSLNVSLDYANNSNSSEDAEEKRKKKSNIQDVVPSVAISEPDINVSKSKKRHSLQEQFTILSETPEIKRRRSMLPQFTISENSNKNKRKSMEQFEVTDNKKTKIVEEKNKSKMPLAEADSVHESKQNKTKKTIQPGTNVKYLPEDILVAIENSSPKVSSSEISEVSTSKDTKTIRKKKVKIAPSVKMNQYTNWEIDEVATKPSKKNNKGDQQKVSKKLQEYTETFPSNDFKNRTLYNPQRNRRQETKQILANRKARF